MSPFPHDVGEMTVCNEFLGEPTRLREFFDERGYLLLRGVLSTAVIAELRGQIVEILARHGWIEPGPKSGEARAIGFPFREGEDGYFAAHDEINKLESFHAIAHQASVIDIMRQVLGPSAFPHPLSVVRMVFPENPEVTTPPHQDFPNNQGSTGLTAAWIPLGDCPQQLGSLAVLEGSHRFGVLPLEFHLGPGNRMASLDERFDSLRWVSTDFESGDMLVFGSMTVHGAQTNQDQERMRLSVDFRYQLEGEPATEGCFGPHFERLTWPEIYEDWDSDEYKNYWSTKDYELVPWDPDLHAVAQEGYLLGHHYEKVRDERFRTRGLQGS